MNKNRKLINALLVSTMMLTNVAPVAMAASGDSVIQRLGGDTRVETSVEVSNTAYTSAENVVIAGYSGEADALTGTLLAAAKNAPLLLVSNKADDIKEVKAELVRLGAKNVYLLGGENVISKDLAAEFSEYNVKRVYGDGRFETAAEVAKEVGGEKDHVFLTNDGRSGSLADALAAGTVSGRDQIPVLLTSKDEVPAATIEAMKDLKASKVTVVGGESAVSANVVKQLEDAGYTVDRVDGDTRWETAEKIATEYFENNEKVIIANDGRSTSKTEVYADALMGGYLGAKEYAPILLSVPGSLNDTTKNYLSEHASFAYVLGGESAISKAVFNEAKKTLEDKVEEDLAVTSVSPINAKTLKVTMNRAVSTADQAKAEVEAKRGSIKPSVKEVKFAEDGKSVTVEFNTKMLAGDYTVTVSGLTEEALTGEVKVEAEKLASIEFLSDIAVLSGDDVTTNVVAKNQYGEEINSKLPTTSVSVSKGESASITNKGVLKVVGDTNNVFKVDDKVVVTIVDSTTGVTATKTLTVAKAANVDSINVEEIKTDDTELAKKELNVTNYTGNEGKYYFPVVAKDQYGNDLTVAQLNGSVTVTSSNKAIVNPAEFKEVKGKAVLGLKAAESGDTQTHGTAVLTFVAASTGKTATVSVTVKEDAKLDVVTLEGISLIQNVASELPITIVDTYGEKVNLFDVTVGGNDSENMTLNSNTTIKATGAKLEVKKDLINKTAKLEVTPSAKNVTLQVVSATGKPQVLTLTAEEAPVVTSIKGLDKDFVSLLANDVNLNTDLKSAVEFTDQYGEKFAVDSTIEYKENETSITKSYYMIEEKNDNNVTTFDKSTGVITASANAGNETYTVTLKDKDKKVLDTFDVTITVVDANKITSFGMNDLDKFYTKTSAASTHTQQVEIYGLHNNRKVVVNQNMIQDVYASNGLTGFTNKGLFTPADITTDGKDMSATLNVLVANKANTYTLTKDVVYSDADPVAETIVAKYNNKEVTGAVQVTAGSYDLSDKSANLHFLVKDQYGKELITGLKVVGTNATGSAGVANDKDLTIAAGESIQLNARINGKSLSIKVLGE